MDLSISVVIVIIVVITSVKDDSNTFTTMQQFGWFAVHVLRPVSMEGDTKAILYEAMGYCDSKGSGGKAK